MDNLESHFYFVQFASESPLACGRPVGHNSFLFIDKSAIIAGLRIEEDRLNGPGAAQPREHWIAQAYDALEPSPYRYALMILTDRGLAEDAVQQAFTRLLSRGRVGDVASAKALLRVIVRNEAYRLLSARRPTQTLEQADVRLLQPADDSVERLNERRQLEQALRQLPPDQREGVHPKVYEQLSFAGIAQLLAIPLNTAASRYRYAIAHLREFLPAQANRPRSQPTSPHAPCPPR